MSRRNQIHVHRAKHGRHYWLVDDYRPPKVFVRRFVFSYYSAAINEAQRLAITGQINPRALFSVHRIEYDEVTR